MTDRRSLTWVQLVLLVLGALPAGAQIPEKFTNLKVLPQDIERRELVATMRGFATALGVRCIHCHVGDDPADLSTVDFVSDARDAKVVARAMIQMVGEINGRLLPATGREKPLEVTCITCHHGLTRPQTLASLLVDTAEQEGAAAALERYRALKAEHYGDGAYDFSVRSLSGATESLAGSEGQGEAALALARLNTEEHPDTAWAHVQLGQLLLAQGDRAAAVASFERALELEPDNGFVQAQLERARPAAPE